MKNASHTTKRKGVPSAGPTTASPADKEKNINPTAKDAETTNLHDELVDLLGIDIVTRYYNKKLLYDRYHDKILKRRKSSKIINCAHKSSLSHYKYIGKMGQLKSFQMSNGSKTKEGLCKELQFSLVDNSKLNVVYLLDKSLKHFVSLLEGLQGGKKIALCQKE
uniref:Uncharacterized protein n=1 Tax=Tanacetum cinerariifolium TaxID=118510 RepID=A0A699H0J1_TANCI|nr:hypothetical protein [Tanacetum cinerariifolium]